MPSETTIQSPPTPIFERLDDHTWRATAHARGPFNGVHGGSVAGLMAAAMEAALPPEFRPLAFRADFLKPTPVGVPVRLRIAPVQCGRRLAVLDAEVTAEGRTTARGSLTLASEVPVPALVEHAATAPPVDDPERLPDRTAPAAHGEAWIMEVMSRRLAPDGTAWFRWRVPLLEGIAHSPYVAALGPADFAHGIARPGFPGPSPVPGYPNCDLAVHFDRAPRGEWIGVRPATRWRRTGVGIGFGDLVDLHGPFGRVAMGVILVPG